jgi:hypothetical protein
MQAVRNESVCLYDDNGNRQIAGKPNYGIGINNQLAYDAAGNHYEYDAEGNRIRMTVLGELAKTEYV